MKDQFVPIKDFEGFYAVNPRGVITSLDRMTSNGRKRKAHVLRPAITCGYYYVNLSKNGKQTPKRVNRVVAEAFIPNPENLPHVHHLDHDRLNNNVENLAWVTHQQNMDEALLAGRLDAKSRGYGVKLTSDQLVEIWKLLEQGVATDTIGPMFGVSGRNIRHIRSGHSWSGPKAVGRLH